MLTDFENNKVIDEPEFVSSQSPLEAQLDETEENILSAAKIAEWKDEYNHIYKTVVGDLEVIWHKLSRKEYVSTMTDVTSSGESKIFDRQDAICKKCILFPSNIEELIAENGGLAGSIADEILLKSGFDISDTEEL